MAVQLRLGFAEPTAAVTLRLEAVGLRVRVVVQQGTSNDAHAYLAAAGALPEMSASGLTFPLSQFAAVATLPEQVLVFADETLRPLLEWVEHPCDDNLAVDLAAEPDGSLWMRWVSHGVTYSEGLGNESITALVAADVPFLATEDAFEKLRQVCHLPVLIGRCRANRAGYIEIETARPQLVEANGLPGLFRIDETHYGLPLPLMAHLANRPGFVWDDESGPVRLETAPQRLPAVPARLSRHVAADLRPLVDALAAYRTQVVSWDSGLGRRVFVLAALEALDAFPALVVCTPDRLWQWWRHAQLFSRSVSAESHDTDVRLTTYDEFATMSPTILSAQAFVFDDVTSPAAESPQVSQAAVYLGGMLDCYLIGLTDELPNDPKQLLSVMSRLRPAEFPPGVSLTERYGTDVRSRLSTHAHAYTSTRSAADPGKDAGMSTFNHTQVHGLDMPETFAEHYREVSTRTTDVAERLRQLRELVSTGSKFAMSPKIAEAMAAATTALDSGRRVAVVAPDEAAAALLRSLLLSYTPAVAHTRDGAAPRARAVIVTGPGRWPDLTWFDEVIVTSYPPSFSWFDVAIGDPRSPDGPLKVTCLHLRGTTDDDDAVAAARAASAEDPSEALP